MGEWWGGGACLIGRNWIIELIDVNKREAAEQTANLQHLKYLQSHDVVSATPLQPLVVTVERYDDSRNHCSILLHNSHMTPKQGAEQISWNHSWHSLLQHDWISRNVR